MRHINDNFSAAGLSGQSEKSTIPFVVLLAIEMAVVMPASPLYADTSLVWDRAAYWDGRYPSAWTGGEAVRNTLEYAGYEVLDANQLKAWMDARIADGIPSVVVFCRDIARDGLGTTRIKNQMSDMSPAIGSSNISQGRFLLHATIPTILDLLCGQPLLSCV